MINLYGINNNLITFLFLDNKNVFFFVTHLTVKLETYVLNFTPKPRYQNSVNQIFIFDFFCLDFK